MTVRFDVPSAIPRFDETVFSDGDGGIAENLGVVSRVNSVQATRSYRPAAFSALVHIILAGDCRSGAEDTQRGGDCECDESLLSTHGSFLLLPERDTDRI
jgi:hypothetical protein